MIQLELALAAISTTLNTFGPLFRKSDERVKLEIYMRPEEHARPGSVHLNGGMSGAFVVEFILGPPPRIRGDDPCFDGVVVYEWYEGKLWYHLDGSEPRIKKSETSFAYTPHISEVIERIGALERALAEERAAFEKFKAKVGTVLRVD